MINDKGASLQLQRLFYLTKAISILPKSPKKKTQTNKQETNKNYMEHAHVPISLTFANKQFHILKTTYRKLV